MGFLDGVMQIPDVLYDQATAKAYSYSDLKRIAKMSVEEFKASDLYDKGFLGMNEMSEDEIQSMIDRTKDAVSISGSQNTTWNQLMQQASNNYDDMYAGSLSYLERASGVTDDQWNEAYNASVSDNYATGNTSFGDGTVLENVTVNAGDDNVEVDWSELQYMKKTQLADGEFKTTKDCSFDSDAKVGDTKKAAGGTITYLGTKNVTYDRDGDSEWHEDINPFNKKNWGTDMTTQMVHYEGYLGSFDYDANEFRLGYWQCKVGDEYINVPVLHYINAGPATNLANTKLTGFTDGSVIQIPEGLKIADYMFADTCIESMPKLPETLESAHCMFMGCTDLQEGCAESKHKSGNHTGTLEMPDSLKDASWMFAGCSQMRDYFGEMGRNLLDGRYAFAECEAVGWDGKTLDEKGDMVTSFKMPDLSKIRYGNSFWLQNMFDGCDDAVILKIRQYIDDNGSLSSEWTSEDGVHYNNYDKLVDGSYNPDLMQAIESESARGQILQLIDKDSKGLTGVASDTAGLSSYGVQITEDGSLSDNSVWAKFRQSDFAQTFNTDNQFGDILNHAIPAVGTYAISKSLLNKMTGEDHKVISTIGAVALAVVPQIVGVGNTLTPMLDWTANAVGPDTKVGSFLTNLSNKLKGNVTYHTKVSELNVDETFEQLQDSAVDYAANQVGSRLMAKGQNEGDYEGVLLSSVFDISGDMKANGKLLASDANLLFISCEPEENLKMTLSDSIMTTSVEALHDKMELELESAKGDSKKITEIRDKYSNQFMTVLYNMNVYDDAAVDKLESLYGPSPELKAQAMNGLEKVMRCTAEPLYRQMSEIQAEFKEKYGMEFLSDKQLNESEGSTKAMSITGLGTFNDFDPNKNYADGSDKYVEKLETYQKALVEAVDNATSQEEIDAAYASYYESAYGWALDEAEAHGVVLDKRGAQTSAEKDSFAEYVAKVEAEQTNNLNAENDVNTQAEKEQAATDHASTEAASKTELPETARVLPDGVIFDAEYYAKTYPDVADAVGNDFNKLYTHYIAFGLSEGRSAYEGDLGQTLPSDYTDEIIAEYQESFNTSCNEYAEEKAAKRAAMVGIEDTDTADAEKTSIEGLKI